MASTPSAVLSTAEASSEAVAPLFAIDRTTLQAYLQSQLSQSPLGSTSLQSIHQFKHGQSNPTYLLTWDNGEKMVLRKQPPGPLLKGAHNVLREAQIIRFLSRYSDVPVPSVLAVCDDPSIIGTVFYVMSHVRGIVFRDLNLPTLSAQQRSQVYASVAQVLAKLHSIDVMKTSEGRALLHTIGGSPQSFASRQVATWKRQYLKSMHGGDESRGAASLGSHMLALAEALEARIPSDDASGLYSGLGARIVHGDWRLDNIIFDAQNPGKILAVLDWELTTIGDSMADMCYFSIPYHLPSAGLLRPVSLQTLSPGVPDEKIFFELYQRARLEHTQQPLSTSLSPSSSTWNFYLALGLFRMASIAAGVAARSKHGNASSGRAAAQFGMLVPILADLALALLSTTSKETSTENRILTSKMHEEMDVSDRGGYQPSARCREILKRLKSFVDEVCIPLEQTIIDHYNNATGSWPTDRGNKWIPHPQTEDLKRKAQAAGLWNLWLPHDLASSLKKEHPKWDWDTIMPHHHGLSNLDYAFLAIESGRCLFCPEAINCSAPDTGNMEIIGKFGTPQQREKWLLPLLLGHTRSCFAMTEVEVASSDPTQLKATALPAGDDGWVISGRKWWTTGACDPRCDCCIFVAVTGKEGDPPHRRHSLFLLSINDSGVNVVRPLTVFGYDDAPHGHAEVLFQDVKVSKDSVLGQIGRGFDHAQSRLGPGRIHHCSRLIGHCKRAIEEIITRGTERRAFGKALLELGGNSEKLAQCEVTLRSSELTVLDAALELDICEKLHKLTPAAMKALAITKIAVPKATEVVLDFAIQLHGGGGLSSDNTLAAMFAAGRTLRLVDGPDEVHLRTIAKIARGSHTKRSKL
jgi:acyl-CoA dehydrogenase